MELDEISEGNKLIAEFMGLIKREFTNLKGKKILNYVALPEPLMMVPVGYESWLLYHDNWEWVKLIVLLFSRIIYR